MRIVDFDPAAGQAFQGDIAIVPIPPDIAIDRRDEIAPRDRFSHASPKFVAGGRIFRNSVEKEYRIARGARIYNAPAPMR